jgi:hypothetical protein
MNPTSASEFYELVELGLIEGPIVTEFHMGMGRYITMHLGWGIAEVAHSIRYCSQPRLHFDSYKESIVMLRIHREPLDPLTTFMFNINVKPNVVGIPRRISPFRASLLGR